MNFKQYFENEEISNKIYTTNASVVNAHFEKEKFDKIFDVLKSYAIEEGLPHPTTYLNHGTNAIIFNTQNENLITRIVWDDKFGIKSCDKVMNEKKFQDSGGVGKIYAYEASYNGHEITYKEKLNTNWQKYIKDKYLNDANNIIKILSNMNNFYRYEDLDYLNEFDALKNLVSAIRLGLPTFDLHADNFAIDKKNNIVVIDC